VPVLTFTLDPVFKSVDTIRTAIRSALVERYGTESRGADTDEFCQVISELVNNAVEHGSCTRIEAALHLTDREALFRLTTDGIPFDPVAATVELPEAGMEDDLPEGGFGLAIIRWFSDRVHYEYRDDLNIVEVVKIYGGE
jgi:anti-sigma regulatory factor (Ser/Thr protein kinase)